MGKTLADVMRRSQSDPFLLAGPPAPRPVIRELWMRGAQPDDDFVQRGARGVETGPINMMKLLCRMGLHNWRREPDVLGMCGMGLEWFEHWQCKRCPTNASQVRGGGMYQKHRPTCHTPRRPA